MKPSSTVCLVLALGCAVFSTGCGKKGDRADSTKEPKITGSPSDAPVSLLPKWQAGQRYVMRMESAQTMEMPDFAAGRGAQAARKTAPVENNFAQEYSLSVTNAPDGNHGMEMEILAIELQAGTGNQMINYDSRNTVAREGGAFADAFDKVVGGKLWCLVSPDNKVLKVEGIEELFARVEAPPPTDTQPAGRRRAPNRGAATGALRGMYNEEVIKQMIEFASGMPKTLRVGESWKINREVPQPMVGTLLLSMTNTFRGWQERDGKKCARVEFAGTISTKEGDVGDGGGAANVTIHDGIIKGHYWYSPEMLIPVETSIEQNYTVSASGVGGAGGRAGNFSFTAPTKQNVSMRLLEVKSSVAP